MHNGTTITQFIIEEQRKIYETQLAEWETREQALRILKAQSSREERLAIADDVVDNSGAIEDTEARVIELDRQYRQLGTSPSPHERLPETS